MPQQNPERQPTWRRNVVLFALALSFVALPISIARADLVGVVKPPVALSEQEQQLLADNPALRDLAVKAPELLRRAFAIVSAAEASGVTSRGSFEGLDENDVKLLGQNPALLQVWSSSPEASADLLQLIRTAAGSGKSPK